MYLVAALNALLLFLNLYFYGHLPDWLSTKIKEGWGPVFAASIAILGVLWQTNKGFKNLIASQEHQATLNREQTIEANRYERAEQTREKADQKLTLLRALIEELKAGQDNLHSLVSLCSVLEKNYEQLDPKATVDLPALPQFEAVIYKANAAKLDILGSAISHVMQAYARLEKRMKLPGSKSDAQTLHFAILGFKGAILESVKAIQAHLIELENQEQEFADELADATQEIGLLEKQKLNSVLEAPRVDYSRLKGI
ncbi:hypothetical protein [Rhizobium leguminosarum]|uniref:hypothetical protein n=1 Tax=Rhizobium leguminosarum TaxID=384 RepID=UPI003F95A51F